MNEFDDKQQRLQALLTDRGLDGVLLQRASSFAWATCGGVSYVNTASTHGAATLLITRERRCLMTNNIEAERLLQEQGLAGQGWDVHVNAWHTPATALAELTYGLKLGSDNGWPGAQDLAPALARLRAALTPAEGARMRALARDCAAAMQAACDAVRPGQTEFQIASLLAAEVERRGAQAIVNLVATDERVFSYRHPLPTGKTLERLAMLVLGGRRQGLVCSVSRLVHFGKLPDDLSRKQQALACIDAAFIAATRPGANLGDILRRGQQAYAQAGFPDEWRVHHQGGAAGYEPREYLGTPDSTDTVSAGQVFAWNPTIAGSKSEDSILIGETDNEVLTTIPGWPTTTVTIDGQSFDRPAIHER